MSESARSLLLGLLERDPKKRLTIEQVKKHSFFSSIDWEKLARLEITPPVRPEQEDSEISEDEFETFTKQVKIQKRRTQQSSQILITLTTPRKSTDWRTSVL